MTAKQAAEIKDQILLVLNDYRDTKPSPLSREGDRIHMANRILANVKLVLAKKPKRRKLPPLRGKDPAFA